MESISATFAENYIDDVWEKIKKAPVEVFRDGIPVAVIMSPAYYRQMEQNRRRLGRPRRFGLLSDKLRDTDVNDLLSVDVSEALLGYGRASLDPPCEVSTIIPPA
jgi:PHD/YefM family antitoxin component YafN of YafNO toxin-antitoxin module